MFHVERGGVTQGCHAPSPVPLPTYPPTQIPPYVYAYIRTRFFPSILEKNSGKKFLNFHPYLKKNSIPFSTLYILLPQSLKKNSGKKSTPPLFSYMRISKKKSGKNF